MTRLRHAIAASALAASMAADAQEGGDTDAMRDALAAGYKAAFTCSALFNADRPLDAIAENELDQIYPDYRAHVDALPDAVIDRETRRVTVAWSPTLPPRMAAWRPGLGCTQLPIGADASAAETLPRLAADWPGPAGGDNATVLSPDAAPHAPTDPDALERIVAEAFQSDRYGADVRTSGVVVLLGGAIVGERYARGIDATTPQRTWSVAKSVTASVLGAAVQRGLIGVDAPAGLKAWSAPGDPRALITVANLLHMASGLDSGVSGSRTDRLYFGGARMIDTAVGKTMEVAPGARFKYSNNDTLLAMRALRERIGDDQAYWRFPQEAVLHRIGAFRTVLETDWNGDFISSSQVWTTARDLARIGQLYLQDGVWDGERILAEGWTAYVAAPAPAQPNRDWGYGAQFWRPNGADGLPDDVFFAAGHRGQYVVIAPSRDAVIVRRGYDASGGPRFDVTRFAADILTTLPH